jgi:hypothetical protein
MENKAFKTSKLSEEAELTCRIAEALIISERGRRYDSAGIIREAKEIAKGLMKESDEFRTKDLAG